MKALYPKKLIVIFILLLSALAFLDGCGGSSDGGDEGKESGNSSVSSNPASPTNSSNPTDPSNPANPTDPSDPANPTDPSNPANPTDPSNPVNPTDPYAGLDDGQDRCTTEYIENASLSGRLYIRPREAKTWLTSYNQPAAMSDTLEGMEAEKVTLTFPGGKQRTFVTCSDGFFGFKNVKENIGVVHVPREDKENCTTNNCVINFAKKVSTVPWQNGQPPHIKMVTFGDSIPHAPEKSAGMKWFPEYFKDLAAPVANVENVNISVVGSLTDDWLPGTTYNERLLQYKDADIFVFSLGGNDLLKLLDEIKDIAMELKDNHGMFGGFLSGLWETGRLGIKLARLTKTAEGIFNNNKRIIAALHQEAPNADIIWISYPNYAETYSIMKSLPKEVNSRISSAFLPIFRQQIERVAGYETAMVLDIAGYIKKKKEEEGSNFRFDTYLMGDGVHLTQKGHQLYAELLFDLLGGYVLDRQVGKTHYYGYESR